MTKNVVFDEASAERIARAVKIVESWGESVDEPFVEEPVQALPADRLILQGTFEGVWNVGDKKTVEYVADNGDDKEKKDVENPLQDAGVQGEKTKCIIVRVGPKWILAYVDANVFKIGTFDGSWAKGSYKDVDTNNSGTVNVLNLFADVNDAGDSGVSCAIAKDGGWYLIAAEC